MFKINILIRMNNSQGRKVNLSMLDLLLSEELNGEIDDAGIQEEVDTFTFEVA